MLGLILAALPLIIASVGNFIVTWRTSAKVQSAVDQLDSQKAELQKQDSKLSEIHGAVNSNLTKVTTELDAANQHIEELQTNIAHLQDMINARLGNASDEPK